jgi:chitodextrinase
LQVKAVGHKQDAKVSKIQFKPKYAELGRFVWPEQALVGKLNPVASYSTSNIGRTYTFDGFGSTDPDGQVVNWYWTVSDGSVYVGPIIQHTFGKAGSYTVALTVTDQNGLVNSTSAIHSVA